MKRYENGMDFTGKQILVFSTEWCSDCIMLKMYIDQVIDENKEWEFIYIDSDEFPTITSEFGILGIPSFIALSDGVQVDSLISKNAKPKDLINQWIENIKI